MTVAKSSKSKQSNGFNGSIVLFRRLETNIVNVTSEHLWRCAFSYYTQQVNKTRGPCPTTRVEVSRLVGVYLK